MPANVLGRSTRMRRHVTTPRIFRWLSIVLVVGIVMWAGIAIATLSRRHEAGRDAMHDDASVVTAAAELYVALADADATVSRVFLAAGEAPGGDRQRYASDISRATERLRTISEHSGGAPQIKSAARSIGAGLPVYTARVEAARANNKQGYPVGAAYLRDASRRMRDEILPAATDVYRDATTRLASRYDSATSRRDIVVLVVIGLAMLVLLIATQIFLAVRTRRMLNPALVVATVVLGIAVTAFPAHLSSRQDQVVRAQRDDSDAIELLSSARILALRAETASALAVIDRQPTDTAFAFADRLGGLAGQTDILGAAGNVVTRTHGPDASRAVAADYRELRVALGEVHEALATRDTEKSTQLVLGEQNARGRQLDDRLRSEIGRANRNLTSLSGNILADFWLRVALVAITALLALGLVATGLHLRIREYR